MAWRRPILLFLWLLILFLILLLLLLFLVFGTAVASRTLIY
jgi:hypothetical protein